MVSCPLVLLMWFPLYRNPLYVALMFVGYLVAKALWAQLEISREFQNGFVSELFIHVLLRQINLWRTMDIWLNILLIWFFEFTNWYCVRCHTSISCETSNIQVWLTPVLLISHSGHIKIPNVRWRKQNIPLIVCFSHHMGTKPICYMNHVQWLGGVLSVVVGLLKRILPIFWTWEQYYDKFKLMLF